MVEGIGFDEEIGFGEGVGVDVFDDVMDCESW